MKVATDKEGKAPENRTKLGLKTRSGGPQVKHSWLAQLT